MRRKKKKPRRYHIVNQATHNETEKSGNRGCVLLFPENDVIYDDIRQKETKAAKRQKFVTTSLFPKREITPASF